MLITKSVGLEKGVGLVTSTMGGWLGRAAISRHTNRCETAKSFILDSL